jgi:hypothetical protein
MFAELGPLLPMGGASILLLGLLKVWLSERNSWVRERHDMQEQHRRERADLITRIQELERRSDGRQQREEL